VTLGSSEGPIAGNEQAEAVAPKVLVVVSGYAGFHLVSPQTLQAAAEAQRQADNSPYYENFGKLRRSAEISELAYRLSDWDISLEAYAAAIERSAGRQPAADQDGSQRLAALHDVDFDGDDEANAPADSTDFRSDSELDNDVEDVRMSTIEQGMCDDVPADVLRQFAALQNPMFVEAQLGAVDDEHIDAIVAVLRDRGFTIDWE